MNTQAIYGKGGDATMTNATAKDYAVIALRNLFLSGIVSVGNVSPKRACEEINREMRTLFDEVDENEAEYRAERILQGVNA